MEYYFRGTAKVAASEKVWKKEFDNDFNGKFEFEGSFEDFKDEFLLVFDVDKNIVECANLNRRLVDIDFGEIDTEELGRTCAFCGEMIYEEHRELVLVGRIDGTLDVIGFLSAWHYDCN